MATSRLILLSNGGQPFTISQLVRYCSQGLRRRVKRYSARQANSESPGSLPLLHPQAWQGSVGEVVRRACGRLMAVQGPERVTEALQSQWKLILGSASRSRRGIMDSLAQENGFKYEVVTADIDEKAIGDRNHSPDKLVLELARAKAAAIKAKLGGTACKALLLTCDQVVVHNGKIMEKPTSEEEAWAFIQSYATGPAKTVGSVMCTNLWTDKAVEALDIAEVHIRPIPDSAIEHMVAEGFVYLCAGALMVEHPMVQPYIERIDGTVDGVMGIDKQVALRVMSQALTN